MKKLARIPLLVLIAHGLSQTGLAQGCAMCKSSLAAQNDNLILALQTGILVLLIPPLLIVGIILYVAFKYKDTGVVPSPEP